MVRCRKRHGMPQSSQCMLCLKIVQSGHWEHRSLFNLHFGQIQRKMNCAHVELICFNTRKKNKTRLLFIREQSVLLFLIQLLFSLSPWINSVCSSGTKVSFVWVIIINGFLFLKSWPWKTWWKINWTFYSRMSTVAFSLTGISSQHIHDAILTSSNSWCEKKTQSTLTVTSPLNPHAPLMDCQIVEC